jgi:rare lipoprotein A
MRPKGQRRCEGSLWHRVPQALAVSAAVLASAWGANSAAEARPSREQVQREQVERVRTGQARRRAQSSSVGLQEGMASYYAPRFRARPTAEGGRFDPTSDTAAHRTLPLGTVVRVTNLANGRSAIATVRDRGPHARGRIVDVSPKVADELRMRDAGVTRVVLQPISVPSSGSRRPG